MHIFFGVFFCQNHNGNALIFFNKFSLIKYEPLSFRCGFPCHLVIEKHAKIFDGFYSLQRSILIHDFDIVWTSTEVRGYRFINRELETCVCWPFLKTINKDCKLVSSSMIFEQEQKSLSHQQLKYIQLVCEYG